jgi:hypothetical protein
MSLWGAVASRVVMPPEHAPEKIPLWRYQSQLESVFKPYFDGQEAKREKKARETEERRWAEENSGGGARKIGKVARRLKEREAKEAAVEEETDFTTLSRIRRVCSCSAEHRTPEMLAMLDSVLGDHSPFFLSYHKTWRTELLRRIELVELKKPDMPLFRSGDIADAAYFVASGRLTNKLLVGNKATQILEDTAAASSMVRHGGQRSRTSKFSKKTKEKGQSMREYMQLEAFHPGSEIGVDCLRTTVPGGRIRTERDRTCEAIDENTVLFKLSKEVYDETIAFCDQFEDIGITDFFLNKTPGGLVKVFKAMPKEILADFVSCWHLRSYPKHRALAIEGKRVSKIYVLALGRVQVIRRGTTPSSLLVVDQPRPGEFIQTGTHRVAAAVLTEPSTPIYRCKCRTSLITTSASDLFVAEASKFWDWCYENKYFGQLLLDYFSAVNLEVEEAVQKRDSTSAWTQEKSHIVKAQVRELSRSGVLQAGTTAPSVAEKEKAKMKEIVRNRKKANRAIRKRRKKAKERQEKEKREKEKREEQRLFLLEEEEKEKRMSRSVSLPALQTAATSTARKKEKAVFETSSRILASTTSIYERLRAPGAMRDASCGGAGGGGGGGGGDGGRGRRLGSTMVDKERQKRRLEDSMRMHKRRFGSHRLIRGPELRFIADQRYEKFLGRGN